jgi:hypothetical protein
MLQSSDEVKAVEIVINGVDNANLMSVDSTEPVTMKVEEEKVSEDDIDIVDKKDETVEIELATEEEKEEKEKKEEKVDAKEEKKEQTPKKEKKKEEEKSSTKPEDSKSVQKRIGKLTKKMRTAERERDFEKEEKLAEIEKRKEAEKKLEEVEFKSLEGSKPKKADFEDEDEFIEALTDWKIDLKFKSSQTEKREAEVKKPVDEEVTTEPIPGLDDALVAGRDKYEDFDELTGSKDLLFSIKLAEITLETENPEDIMYYLANNPEESERLSSLSDIKAAREIGNLEIKLKAPKKVKKQSKAPEPIKPIKTDSKIEKDPNKMSAKEYREWREKS